jgi:hypothetical protein
MYGIPKPPVYESEESFGMKAWFQKIFTHAQSTTKLITTTTSITVQADIYIVRVNATGGARTITLPAAAANEGRVLVIKKIDASANAVTVDGNAAETIDGALTFSLPTQYKAVLLYCNGSGWDVISTY